MGEIIDYLLDIVFGLETIDFRWSAFTYEIDETDCIFIGVVAVLEWPSYFDDSVGCIKLALLFLFPDLAFGEPIEFIITEFLFDADVYFGTASLLTDFLLSAVFGVYTV